MIDRLRTTVASFLAYFVMASMITLAGLVSGAFADAAGLAITDATARFSWYGIGVLVGLGFYMPFAIVLTYTIGNFLRIAADKAKGYKWVEDVGIPLAAGLIVGEALVGVGNALWIVGANLGAGS